MSAPRLAVVGTGAVAGALARAYVEGGAAVAVVVSRSATSAESLARAVGAGRGSDDLAAALDADVVLVAVPDRAVAEVGGRLGRLAGSGGPVVFHTSGVLVGEALGCGPLPCGSLHPLQTFSGGISAAASRVAGTHWFHEGARADVAERLVDVWHGSFHQLAPGGKALYHAAAAILSNHTVALFDMATRLFEDAGVSAAESRAPLAALLSGTAGNLAQLGVPGALTGPVARGDVETVRTHLAALSAAAPDLLSAYRALAARALVVARAKGGLTPDAAAALERLLG